MKTVNVTEAIVLAGGLGTRLRPAVGEIPKPMAPVSGRPFLEHLLTYWAGQGIKRFILSVAYKHEQIEKHFGKHFGTVEIDYAVDENLGTGGALMLAASKIKGRKPFLVVNGDTFFDVPLSPFLSFHKEHSADVTLAVFRTPDASRFGRVHMSRAHQIESFDSPAPGAAFINGGVYLFEPEFFESKENSGKLSLEADIFPKAVESGRRFYAFPHAGHFIDIGTPESYAACENVFHAVEERKYA